MPQRLRIFQIHSRTHLQRPSILATDRQNRSLQWRTQPNRMSILLYPPRGLVQLEFIAYPWQPDQIRITNQVIRERVDSDADRSIFLGLHPGMSTVIKPI